MPPRQPNGHASEQHDDEGRQDDAHKAGSSSSTSASKATHVEAAPSRNGSARNDADSADPAAASGSSPLPTPSKEELDQLELELTQRLRHSEWKPSVYPWQRTLARSQARFRVHCVREEVNELRDECEQARRRLERRRAEFAARRERLKSARELEAAETSRAESIDERNTALRKRQTSLGLSLHRRRVALLRALEQIYPIELTDPANFLFSIADIPLPSGTSSALDGGRNSGGKAKEKAFEPEITLKSQDAEVTAAALGLVAQLVTLLSAYLDTPVHYPLATAGSRSIVQDAISIMNGPRAFPLYSKGVESYRFEYAVFLLNKDVEQLVNEHHVPLIDLRQTLPNLKNLMNTIISATSPKAYTSQSARRHISARAIALSSTTSSPPPSILQLQPHPSPPPSAGFPHHNHHHHPHYHIGKGHPFSSSSSTTSSAAAPPGLGAGPTGSGAGPGAGPARLHGHASVSISVASASGSTNGSDITVPAGYRTPDGADGARRGSGGASPGWTTNQSAGGAAVAGHGPGHGTTSRSTSAASTWAASLLGWKTFYSNGSGASSEASLVLPSPTPPSAAASTSAGGGQAQSGTDGVEGDDATGGQGRKPAEEGPPTVRRLGAAK